MRAKRFLGKEDRSRITLSRIIPNTDISFSTPFDEFKYPMRLIVIDGSHEHLIRFEQYIRNLSSHKWILGNPLGSGEEDIRLTRMRDESNESSLEPLGIKLLRDTVELLDVALSDYGLLHIVDADRNLKAFEKIWLSNLNRRGSIYISSSIKS